MMYRTLISCGYVDAACAMERECNVDLTQWEMADNMDLYYVVQDFEEYFEIKFMKKPVFVKKNPFADDDVKQGRMRKPPAGGSRGNLKSNRSTAATTEGDKPPRTNSTNNSKSVIATPASQKGVKVGNNQ